MEPAPLAPLARLDAVRFSAILIRWPWEDRQSVGEAFKMSFMSCRHAFKRVLRRIAAPLLMLPLTALMAVGQAAADPLRPGEVMLDYYGHGAVRVTAPGGERVMFDR